MNKLLIFLLIFLHIAITCGIDDSSFIAIKENAIELSGEGSLDILLSKAAGHKLVLLGESTHGTSEFYQWRYLISRRLIEEHGYDFIVVEGDWTSFYAVNRFVNGKIETPDIRELMRDSFTRWPQWMWANEETVELLEWLRDFNGNRQKNVGIYGMDVYSKKESIAELRSYFGDMNLKKIASEYDCFTQYGYDGSNYARAVYFGDEGCEKNVRRVVEFLRNSADDLNKKDADKYFNAKQNAIIVKNAEKHFRTSVVGGSEGWNSRVFHFQQTIDRLLQHYGKNAKGIVWAHNTHIGDARATSMSSDGSKNIGQLSREEYGKDNVFLIGFGTNQGEVLAGSSWGAARQLMTLPNGAENSIEMVFDKIGKPNFYLIFDEFLKTVPVLNRFIGHRAVGVVYNPARENQGNYVPTILSERYDAFIFLKATTALSPLHK